LENLKLLTFGGTYCSDIFHHKTNHWLTCTIVEFICTIVEFTCIIVDEDGKTVVVILAGTRANFYRELKRYIK